jgi:dipeptidyl aminopeptidase/acylaminoacyl peptidase
MHKQFLNDVICAIRTTAGLSVLLSAALLPAAVSATAADPAKPSLETFFSNPNITEAALSPDGKFVAWVVSVKDGRLKLAVMDLAVKEPKVISGFSDGDITGVRWVNNRRLVYSTTDTREAQGEVRYWPGLFSVDRDGSEYRILVGRSHGAELTTGTNITKRILPVDTYFFDVDRSGASDDIFVWQPEFSITHEVTDTRLLRLNTRSGLSTAFDRPRGTIAWLIDQAGVPRINVTLHDGVEEVYYRDPATDQWRKIAGFNAYSGAWITPKYFGADGTLYVVANRDRQSNALYRFDLEKNAVDPQPLIAIDGYDFSSYAAGDGYMRDQFIVNATSKKLLGVRYQTDASATAWFDDDMKKIQKSVDSLLPATANILSVARNGSTNNVLVRAHSDVQPAMFLIYDTAANKLVSLGSSHPDVNPKQMSQQDMVHYAARDGLQIPAYLTLPRGSGKKNLPLVVLVHGGPYLRGASWGWNPEVQFLASRGYAVLQPEYRGSTGFGFNYYHAGWKQWGLAMQDDIADGARWAIAQGIADPKRICIAGASYGGYATLMGLAKDPDLFRCGVDWVGVADINLMFKSNWTNDASEEWQRFGMPILIGDPVKDAEQIRNTSPVNFPNRITQPLLMAYGGADLRVPMEHGTKFRDAVRPYNDRIEWIDYPAEGHGWRLVKTRIDFWGRVEKFLDANIGSGASAAMAGTSH